MSLDIVQERGDVTDNSQQSAQPKEEYRLESGAAMMTGT